MNKSSECCSTHLIDGDGTLNVAGIENFMKEVKLAECGLSYVVVSIMGPQSSGMNYYFRKLLFTCCTSGAFPQSCSMNYFLLKLPLRSQTTKGIWLARCPGIEPCTLVMDLEGTDGRERGEDDTAFEKQSALFALAVSDIVLINMWCHDIGREQAANKPLLKTVFQATGGGENIGEKIDEVADGGNSMRYRWHCCHGLLIGIGLVRTIAELRSVREREPGWLGKIRYWGEVMMRLFSPRKTTLMFVIRDKTRTPLENLEPVLRDDIQKIWDSVPKPQAHKETPLNEFFNVEVVALSSYEEKEESFKEQVASLRQQFVNSIAPGGLAGDRTGVVPASGFSFSAEQIWKIIKENKDLDLPAHKVMVATVRCEEIANEKLASFVTNEEWCQLDAAVQTHAVSGFGKKLNSIIDRCMSDTKNLAGLVEADSYAFMFQQSSLHFVALVCMVLMVVVK
ncbi:hypothetical protein U1Q18_026894 [Sarracenia purpurea var. burkii]